MPTIQMGRDSFPFGHDDVHEYLEQYGKVVVLTDHEPDYLLMPHHAATSEFSLKKFLLVLNCDGRWRATFFERGLVTKSFFDVQAAVIYYLENAC